MPSFQSKKFPLIASFDLEPEWATVPIRYSSRLWENSLEREVYAAEAYLDLCEEFGHKATFFVVGMFAKKTPRLIKKIVDLGHEIGSHSMTHADMRLLSVDEFLVEATRSKDILQDIAGTEVVGFRAPSFSISAEQINMLSDIGYKYDSSTTTARRIYGGNIEVTETLDSNFKTLSFSGMKFCGKEFTILGGGYLRIVPLQLLRFFSHEKLGNMYYIHPHDFYRTPSSYRHFTKRERALRRFNFGNMSKKIRYLHETYQIITAVEAIT